MSLESKIYNEGYIAAEAGMDTSECPYPIDSVERAMWEDGYFDYCIDEGEDNGSDE
jgi:ribosome modulation factor